MRSKLRKNTELVFGLLQKSDNVIKALLPIVLGFILLAVPASATTLTGEDDYADFLYVNLLPSGTDASSIGLTTDEFLSRAGRVMFRINRFDKFVSDTLFHQMEKEFFPLVNKDSLRLTRVMVRGAASPDGPYPNNTKLSQHRTAVLLDFLRKGLALPMDPKAMEVEAIPEDYELLCALMRRAGDADASRVEELVKQYVPKGQYDQLKRVLAEEQQGRLWERLKDKYFPQLRAAWLVLFFEKNNSQADDVSDSSVGHHGIPLKTVEPVGINLPPVLPEFLPLAEVATRQPRRELLSVKTNLLFDVAYMPGYDRWCPIPNVALEFYPLHGHFTVGASFDCPWWQDYWDHKYFQIRNYQVEGRYYFRSGDILSNPPGKGPAFRGLYLQGYAHLGLYGICFDADHGWEGEGIGAGVGAGYVLPLGKRGHWRMEFGLQVGFFYTGYDPYQYENPVNPNYRDHLYYYKWTGRASAFRERRYRFTWVGPTRVGVTLSYDLLYRRLKKRGVSFRPFEKP